ncbi:hypothetical protein [Roseateles chitosanitabidus]|jgi:hypothetical protein|uniref:hypothetical protein n=1 Tax=Roseateles chitosanitabidus TaxID=65048 RepID=UPI00082B4A85|nr:hypothetical protein [Roseateles chitosanitabidus]MBO9686773.1 hypothetical protein [Roseateles chitosanitabidus]
MKLFNTLLLREWLQYRRSWIGLTLGPVLVLLALVPISQVEGLNVLSPEPVALVSMALTLGLVLALVLATCGYMLMSLARRDSQDRSIEFWASLPGSHGASVAAPLLAHGLLVPIVAIVVAVAGGLLVGAAMSVRELGFASLQQMQWAAVFEAAIWLVIRLGVGLALAVLWFSPIALALMAASAWVKRWGAPLLVIAVSAFLKIYKGEPAAVFVSETLRAQMAGVGRSVIFAGQSLVFQTNDESHFSLDRFYEMLYGFPGGAREDLISAIQLAMQPRFFVGLAVAGLCFWLLVLQRRRNL